MINNVRQSVLDLIRKANNGYLTPDEFNRMSHMAQLDIFDEIMSKYADAVVKRTMGLGGMDVADIEGKYMEAIETFIVPESTLTYSAPNFLIPSDCYKIIDKSVVYNSTVPVSKVEGRRALAQLRASNLTAPSTLFPVYSKVNAGIRVEPTTIVSGIKMDYIRYPKTPKWTYTVVPGSDAPLFNISAVDYQDFELPKFFEDDLIIKILQYAGVSLREAELIQATKSEEIQNKQEQ